MNTETNAATSASETRTPRQRILQTAHDLFYQEGIRATGIDQIIQESAVAKRTFYRQFESKNALILAFLEDRHERWMTWFDDSLKRHGEGIEGICHAMLEWFTSDTFRGCAFINTVGELAGELPEVVGVSQRHKDDMERRVKEALPECPHRANYARTLCVAIDGAIIQAQIYQTPHEIVDSLLEIADACYCNCTNTLH